MHVIRRRVLQKGRISTTRILASRIYPTARLSSTTLPRPGLSSVLHSAFASASTKFTGLWLLRRLVCLSMFLSLSNFDRRVRSDPDLSELTRLAALSAAVAYWMLVSEITFVLHKLDRPICAKQMLSQKQASNRRQQ
ncbi:hypothetical protein VNO80_24928 [Phaseolus coccineus]|uniref:Uncharacterized protein n=1 Tax=Phaseolus coccineus TaxID=3886 RepID=A0AAN9QNH7_PHACN